MHWNIIWRHFLHLEMFSFRLHDTSFYTSPSTEKKIKTVTNFIIRRKLAISIGLSSQWNFGKKMHSWPAPQIKVSSIEGWFLKSSCWLRRCAMQQFSLSMGHTGAHLARSLWRSGNHHSSRTHFNPLVSPFGNFIVCSLPQNLTLGFVMGITVSFCFHCFPPSDLFQLMIPILSVIFDGKLVQFFTQQLLVKKVQYLRNSCNKRKGSEWHFFQDFSDFFWDWPNFLWLSLLKSCFASERPVRFLWFSDRSIANLSLFQSRISLKS